jgi:hypothetical protein
MPFSRFDRQRAQDPGLSVRGRCQDALLPTLKANW